MFILGKNMQTGKKEWNLNHLPHIKNQKWSKFNAQSASLIFTPKLHSKYISPTNTEVENIKGMLSWKIWENQINKNVDADQSINHDQPLICM